MKRRRYWSIRKFFLKIIFFKIWIQMLASKNKDHYRTWLRNFIRDRTFYFRLHRKNPVNLKIPGIKIGLWKSRKNTESQTGVGTGQLDPISRVSGFFYFNKNKNKLFRKNLTMILALVLVYQHKSQAYLT